VEIVSEMSLRIWPGESLSEIIQGKVSAKIASEISQ
jgi:hypothetical protein